MKISLGDKAIQLLTKGLETNGFPHLRTNKNIPDDEINFLEVKRIILVLNGFDGTYASERKGIIIDTPSSEEPHYLNIVALKNGEGTYLGKCLIQKIMDGELTGNLHVYLRVPK